MCTFFQLRLQIFHVVVLIAKTLCFTQTHTINNRSMIECVADDGILFVEQRFENTTVGIKGSSVKDGIFRTQKTGEFLFKFFVDVLSSADKTYTAHTISAVVDVFFSRFHHLWMSR